MKNKKTYLLLIPVFVITFATTAILAYQWGLLVGLSSTNIDLDPAGSSSIVSTQSDDVLDSDSSTNENSNDSTSDSSTNTNETSSDSTNDSNISTTSSSSQSEEDNGEFSVQSDNTFWQQNSSINIFNGLETVQPGSSGEFTYILSNTRAGDINYTMTINKSENAEYEIPIVYKLKTLSGDYVGGDDWLSADELEEITSIVASGDSETYILLWQWEFDTGNDAANEYDTLLGQTEGLTYTLTITISAYGDSSSVVSGIPTTGENSYVIILAAVLGFSIFALIVVLVSTKRKKEEA